MGHSIAFFSKSLLVVALGISQLAYGAEEFLRGDVDQDGEVTLADAYAISRHLHEAGPAPACMDTADFDDNGWITDADISLLLRGVLSPEHVVPSPYPDAGVDGTPDNLDCAAYSVVPAEPDPGSAVIEILDAIAEGGASNAVVLKVRISNSVSIGAYSGAIENSDRVFTELRRWIQAAVSYDGSSTQAPMSAAFTEEGLVRFGHLADGASPPRSWNGEPLAVIDPSTDHVVLKLFVCLDPGLPAGRYPIDLVAGEMTDAETGLRLQPELRGGELVVLNDVHDDVECHEWSSQHQCVVHEDSDPEDATDVNVSLHLEEQQSEPGGIVTVPVMMSSNAALEGFSIYVDFDHTALQFVEAIPLSTAWPQFDIEFSNQQTPGARNILQSGFVSVVANFGDLSLAPREGHEVLNLRFAVPEESQQGWTDLKFAEPPPREVERNRVVAFGRNLARPNVNCLGLYNSGVFIGTRANQVFLRGDVNSDGRVTIADAATMRRTLFFPAIEREFLCENAADVNDDGSVGLADSVLLLQDLFELPVGESRIAAPFPEAGTDATLDALTCSEYEVVEPESTTDLVRIASVEVVPGQEVEIPILISSSVDVEAFQFVVRYDSGAFTPTKGGLSFEGSVLEGIELSGYHYVNPDNVAEGEFSVGFVGSFFDERIVVPAGESVIAAKIRGTVSNDLSEGESLALDIVIGQREGKDLAGELVYQGRSRLVSIVPEFEGGVLEIVGDVTFFRGDSTMDGRVDISDPIRLLGFLFLGGEDLSCQDAADANDSGDLNVTDAVVVLEHLFSGGSGLAQPFPLKGDDATEDRLGICRPSGS